MTELEKKSRELQLGKCRRSLVFGKVIAVETSNDCRSIQNIESLEDAIAVMDDYCGGRRNVESVVQAGALAVIYITHTNKRTNEELEFQVPVPVLFVSGPMGNRVMVALEQNGTVQGMLGLTTGDSLTRCPMDHSFPHRIVQETCSNGRIELLIPTDGARHALSVFFAGKDMNFIVRRLHRDLREDEEVIRKLLEQEQHPKK